MRRDSLSDLRVFIAVAREQSFTRAAAKLGVSQSALSYTIRTMEARLGVRLLTRTTRSVSLTEAGERLIGSIGPRFDEIESEISALSWHRPLDHGLDGSRVERPRRFCPTIFALHHVSRSCQSRRRAPSAAVFPLKRWRAHLSSVPPKFVRPCIPITAKAIPRGDEWLHEPKPDGYRFQIVKDGDRVQL